MQDLVFNFEDITLLEDDRLFRIEKGKSRPIETEERTVMKMTFEQNFDRNVVERDNYTFLDVLSDVGGLSSIVCSVFASLLAIVNYNNLNAHIVT